MGFLPLFLKGGLSPLGYSKGGCGEDFPTR